MSRKIHPDGLSSKGESHGPQSNRASKPSEGGTGGPIANGIDGPGLEPYRELFERSADAILIIESETFIDCNQATVDMLRYRDKAQVLETHPSQLSPLTQPDGRSSFEKANEMIAIAFERGNHRFEWDHQRADGEVFPVEVLLTAVQQDDRKVLHVVWRDITERKRLELELRHAQKMEAIGKLAGGVAHDFNNLLLAIVGNADLLRQSLKESPSVFRFVNQIQLAADRASDLVQQLLAFSRKQEIVEETIDLNVVIERVQNLLERLIGEDIKLETARSETPLLILGDSGQIEQVLMNLVTNARDAMPECGVLSISTRLIDATQPPIGESSPLTPGAYAMISVADTGIGMDAETQSQAFDPFFTSKEQGKGTGLGLSTVYGIVQGARGHVSIKSALGKGTTVNVYLPIHQGALEAESAEPAASPQSGGCESILLVEDEQSVSMLLAEALTRKGYRVLVASDGREALELYLKRGGNIDLIVTDVIMPEISGPRMIEIFHSAGHSPRVLFISGYTDSELSRLKEIDAGVDLLRKPFHADELTRRVRLALDRKPSR